MGVRLRFSNPAASPLLHNWSREVLVLSRSSPSRKVVKNWMWSSVRPVNAQLLYHSTSHGHDLPTSPLADEKFLNARTRWTRAKPAKPPYKLTKFQRKMAVNPFGKSLKSEQSHPKRIKLSNTCELAQILASPARCCPLTKVFLPRDCLQGFKLVAHPVSGDPWWVPPDLVSDVPSKYPTAPSDVFRGPTVYTLPKKNFLRSFFDVTGKYRKGYRAFLRMSSSPNSVGILGKAVWREDMSTHVLELMRRRVYRDLLFFSELGESQGRRYLLSSDNILPSTPIAQLGCLLNFSGRAYSGLHDGKPGDESVLLSVAKMQAPTYDMYDLLGAEHFTRLQQQSKIFSSSKVIVLRGVRTVRLHQNIWKLQSYIRG